MNELTAENKAMSVFEPEQFDHWHGIAQKLATSEMIPRNYKGKPMDILISIDMGRNVGLPMMQSLQSIAVINGMPCMYGDAPLAVCQNHPSFEWINEEPIIKNDAVFGYRCSVKRINNEAHTVIFTKDDAKKAGLLGKAGPWTQYESRMLQMRARGFALRNTFPDALKGIKIKEEIEDHTVIEATWEPKVKQSQSDKLNSLLEKKGFNHEANSQNRSNDSDTNNNTHDTGLCSANSNPSPHASERDIRPGMVADGESKDSLTDTQNVPIKCSTELLDIIECALSDKGFDEARKIKALKYFGVKTFAELTNDQANEMIKIIERAE